MFHGSFLKSSHGSLLSISGVFLVVLFMGHPSCRKLTFLGLPALEIGVVFFCLIFGLPVGSVAHSPSTSVLKFSANCVEVLAQQSNICITQKLVLKLNRRVE